MHLLCIVLICFTVRTGVRGWGFCGWGLRLFGSGILSSGSIGSFGLAAITAITGFLGLRGVCLGLTGRLLWRLGGGLAGCLL